MAHLFWDEDRIFTLTSRRPPVTTAGGQNPDTAASGSLDASRDSVAARIADLKVEIANATEPGRAPRRTVALRRAVPGDEDRPRAETRPERRPGLIQAKELAGASSRARSRPQSE
jgi:hypothetical protein